MATGQAAPVVVSCRRQERSTSLDLSQNGYGYYYCYYRYYHCFYRYYHCFYRYYYYYYY